MFSAPELDIPSPWHEGELQMQRRAGALEKMDELGRKWIRNHLTEQQQSFYPLLPFAVLGAVDKQGDVWATLRAGPPGFLSIPDETHLHVAAARDANDPAEAGMEDGDAIALLGIQLATRRRNRMNGRIQRSGPEGFTLAIRQAYGNCPQYIQCRDFTFVAPEPAAPAIAPVVTTEFDDVTSAIVRNADTFFVASYTENANGQRGVDVSHRGGNPGFARLDADGGLTIPDFSGNLFFNSFGNFTVNPKAGLTFIGFETGDLLQMTGDVELIFEGSELAAFEGAERLWRFHPRRIVRRRQALPLRWSFMEDGWSPNTLASGTWEDAAKRMAAVDPKAWRAFRIAEIVEESSVVRSLTLEPVDNTPAPTHQAGQFLPIRVTLPDEAEPVQRNYTLSVAPSDARVRISVKREGLVSRHLHRLREGDVIEARAPAGNFLIDAAEPRPVVLLAAGIGVTPMLAMLRHLVQEGTRTGRIRPVWFFQAARNAAERAFDSEISELVAAAKGAVRRIRVLNDATGAPSESYEHIGIIDMDLFRASLPFDDYDFYLCGPPPFMQALYDGLRGLNIADARIHAEAFGPAALRRRPDATQEIQAAPEPARVPVPVTFSAAASEAVWTPGSGSLLELAEAKGLHPDFSCRAGNCGACATRIIEGQVTYATPPSAPISADQCLICCAIPAARDDDAPNRLVLDL